MPIYWWTVLLLCLMTAIVALLFLAVTAPISILSDALMRLVWLCGLTAICIVFVSAYNGIPAFMEITSAEYAMILVEGGTPLYGPMDYVLPDGVDTYRVVIDGQIYRRVAKDQVKFYGTFTGDT